MVITQPTTAERYRRFADVEAAGSSATYQRLAAAIAEDADVLERIDELPPVKRQANLVFAACRYTGAPLGEWPAFRAWLLEHWAIISMVARERATQTNEVRRLTSTLPALASIEGPIALIELGASAGLCLFPDRYSYRYGDGPWLHPARGESSVRLECAVDAAAPVPTRLPDIVWRAGVDLNPLRADDASDVEWLETLIWPEHQERVARLHKAARSVGEWQPRIVAGDLVDALPRLVAEAPADASVVLSHSAVLPYLDAAERDRFASVVASLQHERRGVHDLADEAPLAVGLERRAEHPSDFAVVLDGDLIAWAGQHGDHLHGA